MQMMQQRIKVLYAFQNKFKLHFSFSLDQRQALIWYSGFQENTPFSLTL